MNSLFKKNISFQALSSEGVLETMTLSGIEHT